MYIFVYLIIQVLIPLCHSTTPVILEPGSVYPFQLNIVQAIIPNHQIDRTVIITLTYRTGDASVPAPLLFAGYKPWPNETNFLWTNRGVNFLSDGLAALSTLIDVSDGGGSDVFLTVVNNQLGAMFFLNPERPVPAEKVNITGYVQVHQRKWFVHRNSGITIGPSLFWLDQCDAVVPGHSPDVLKLQWGLYNSLNNWNDTFIYNFEDSIPPEPIDTQAHLHFEGYPHPSVMVEVDGSPNSRLSESYFFVGAFPAGVKVQDELLGISYRMGYSLGRVTLSTELQAYRLGDDLYLGMRVKDMKQKIDNIKVYSDGTSAAISFWNNFGKNSIPRYYMNSACFLNKYSSTFGVGITPHLVYWNSDVFTITVIGFYTKMANDSNSMVNVVVSEPDGYFARKATMAPQDDLKPILPCDPGDSPFFWPFVSVSALALIILSSSIIAIGKLVHHLNSFNVRYSIVK